MTNGGLRRRRNVYEESLRVPLIFSNPRLFPDSRTCDHPASLVDLMPTFAGLLNINRPPGLRGTDLTPMLRDPEAAAVQDEVLFTFDDMHAGDRAGAQRLSPPQRAASAVSARRASSTRATSMPKAAVRPSTRCTT